MGDPACVRGAEVVCSMVTTEVAGCCGVEAMTGVVVVRITIDETGADPTGVDTMTVDGTGAGGTDVDGTGVDSITIEVLEVDEAGVDRAGLDAAAVEGTVVEGTVVEGTVVEGVGVDGGAETIVEPAANVVIPLHVSLLGQHLSPVMHCSPASQ